MFPEWHHAVPESAYFKLPETLKTFRMYSISRFVYVLHWLATRLIIMFVNSVSSEHTQLCKLPYVHVFICLY